MSIDHTHGQALRVEALESLLVEQGLLDAAAVDDVIALFNERVGPMRGASLVARAWVDEAFCGRLLTDATAVVDEYEFEGGQVDKLVVLQNTDKVHNVVVCTLCSCYPWAVLGLPPKWYKDPAYRSRVVREPRAVLAEFGTELDDGVEVRVWDSSAEVRYMVLPQRPDDSEDLDEAALAALVTRDSMIGVTPLVSSYELTGDLAPPMQNGELAFDAPWQGRVFGMAKSLSEAGHFEWSEFQAALIEVIGAADAVRDADTDAEYPYYEYFLAALERVVSRRGLIGAGLLDARVEEFAARPHGHDH